MKGVECVLDMYNGEVMLYLHIAAILCRLMTNDYEFLLNACVHVTKTVDMI